MATQPAPSVARIDRSRFRRVRRFLLGVLVHALVWDVLLAAPLLRRLRTPALPRWRRQAARFRDLAVELGGVLIKLGQFLSTRVDVLPRAVTEELAGLQDRVPPAPSDEVLAQLAEDLGRPVAEVFPSFAPAPLAAASLAQVHEATLADGRPVVVKVLRPGIDVLVETDLAAIASAVGWLRHWRGLRRRVDVEWLRREFTAVTRRELDLVAEGHSAERFARDHADDPGVIVPQVFWESSTARSLTLQNVAAIRVSDTAGLRGAGLDPGEVARHLYRVFLEQLFVSNFVHADPHPGNLFVHPLPHLSDDSHGSRGFAVAFVDFGMMVEIPERLREGLREYAIGLGTRDARRIVQSYVRAGVLLPGADLERLVQVHEDLLARFWGVSIGRLRDTAMAEGGALALEYRDLLFDLPFQVQGDMLFTMRAVGIMAGLATSLDPEFDPWAETLPFARRLAFGSRPTLGDWLDELGAFVRSFARLPGRLDRVLAHIEQGPPPFLEKPAAAAQRHSDHRATSRLVVAVVAAGALIGATILRAADPSDPWVAWLLVAAGAATLTALLLRRG